MMAEAERTKYQLRIIQILTRALDMADNFLQVSRAEVAGVNEFQRLDFVGLVQEAVDGAYEVARTKNLILAVQLPDNHLFLSGDFGLLQRAISNIVLNAIKYSPESLTIEILLSNINN